MKLSNPYQIKYTCGLLAILIVHAAVQLILYRGRTIDHWKLSDLITFALPAMLAAIAYGLFLRLGMRESPGLTVTFALLCAFLSFCGSLLLPLNIYGD